MAISVSILEDDRNRRTQTFDRYQAKLPILTNLDLPSIAPEVVHKQKPHDAVSTRFHSVFDFRNYRLRDSDPSQHARKVAKALKKLNTTCFAIR